MKWSHKSETVPGEGRYKATSGLREPNRPALSGEGDGDGNTGQPLLDEPKTISGLDERSISSESSNLNALESIAITECFLGLESNCGSNLNETYS